MTNSIRVAIIEDDPYARDMIAMLLARDWRTCVILELSSSDTSEAIIQQLECNAIDLAILDVEMSTETEQPFQLAQLICATKTVKTIIYLGTSVSKNWIRSLANKKFGGFLLKSEIRYALVPAVVESFQGKCVITPGVEKYLERGLTDKDLLIMSGQNLIDQFSVERRQIIRLGFIFNLSHPDIADELQCSYYWCAKVISEAYDYLGVQGKTNVSELLPHPRIKQVLEKLEKSKKELRTLAFHVMTIPDRPE